MNRAFTKQACLCRSLISLAIVLGLYCPVPLPVSASSTAARQNSKANSTASSNEVIVKVKASYIASNPLFTLESFCEEHQIQLLDALHWNAQALKKTSPEVLFAARVSDKDSLESIAGLRVDDRVEYAEERVSIPVTPITQEERGVHTLAVTDRWPFEKLQIPQGMSTQIKVGVIDTGFTEGAVDGYDFYHNSTDYSDSVGHGQYVADVFNASVHAQLYSLKCADNNGDIDLLAYSKAIDWAIAHNIKVLNCSFGGSRAPGETERQASQRAQDAGLVVVAAGGNFGKDIDSNDYSWNLPNANILRVAASTQDDVLPGMSNRGRRRMELAAPGLNILFSDGIYRGGTSLAAPWVAALAAILFERLSTPEHQATYNEVVHRIEQTVDFREGYASTTWTGGRANYLRAISGDLNPPADSLTLVKPRIKNGRKFKFGLVLTPLVAQPIGSSVIRFYAGDILLSFIDPSETSFLIKGSFSSGTSILFLSSGGGKSAWTAP